MTTGVGSASAAEPVRIDLSGLGREAPNDQFIVKYRVGSEQVASTVALQHSLDRISAAGGGRKVIALKHVRRIATGADVVRAGRKLDRVEAETLMRQIAADPGVEYVEVDQINTPLLTPNDERYPEQWGYSGTYGIKANQAWDVTNGAGAVVAVLDTGITNHGDLNANVLPGYDFISDPTKANDGNGRDANPADPGDWQAAGQCSSDPSARNSSWHGTHVAGTIAAVTNNAAKGVAGVAHGAKIVPVRVLGTCGGFTSDIADAIIWASGGTVSGVPANANPAEVINLSLGGSGTCSATYQNAINSAVGRGTTLVIAAGNSNVNVSNASPANCANVIAVASTTSTGARSSFSNYGSLIDIAAPGSNILSTLNSGSTTPGSETYASYNGTSMAAPHVAGVVALLQAVSATPRTPAQVEALIKANVTAFPSTPSQPIGPGILNAKAVVDAARGTAPVTGTLSNGVPVNLASAAGTWIRYTMAVPAGATNLSFALSGGTGDGDMYVKFGAAPTETAYDCRPWVTGNNETCNIATAQAGTYYVYVHAYSAISGATLVGKYTLLNTLSRNVPVTGLAAAAGTWLRYRMTVPAGASNLTISMSGGTGDGDMHVKFGSEPNESVYDCRPWVIGNNETCTIPAPMAGTYYVGIKAYSAISGVSLVGNYATATAQTYRNDGNYTIADNATVDSPITVSGRSGYAPATASVTVAIVHTYQGDLKVDLVAPDGSLYNVHNRTGTSTDNINKTMTFNLSSEPLNGTWKLRVADMAGGDTGYIDSWSIKF